MHDNTPFRRFEQSMQIGYEKWHDGIGYDLDALDEASAEERDAIEKMLVARGVRDWRDVEALAALDSHSARKHLQTAMKSTDPEIRAAVLRYAPQLVNDAQRTASLVEALKTAEFFGGLTQTLDQVAEFHPTEVVEELFRGTLEREGEVAVHFAAMLTFIHGKAHDPFDMDQRPFFLRFNTPEREERQAAFRELCARLGVDR